MTAELQNRATLKITAFSDYFLCKYKRLDTKPNFEINRSLLQFNSIQIKVEIRVNFSDYSATKLTSQTQIELYSFDIELKFPWNIFEGLDRMNHFESNSICSSVCGKQRSEGGCAIVWRVLNEILLI